MLPIFSVMIRFDVYNYNIICSEQYVQLQKESERIGVLQKRIGSINPDSSPKPDFSLHRNLFIYIWSEISVIGPGHISLKVLLQIEKTLVHTFDLFCISQTYLISETSHEKDTFELPAAHLVENEAPTKTGSLF